MPSRVKIGVVGLGQRGLQHLRALWQLQQQDQAAVEALCDPFPQNLAAEKLERFVPDIQLDAIRTYTRCDDLLRAGGLDAIYFCIPPSRHDGEVVRAAEAGYHLFVEKPMSLYLDEALAMERAIRRAGVIATAGFQMRHENGHTAVKEFVAGKRLVMITWAMNGAMEAHSVKHTHTEALGGPANRAWTANMAWSGSTAVEAGIHQLDLMRYWAGDVAWTQATYVHRDPSDVQDGGDNPYAYSVTFGFKSGLVGNLVLTRLRQTFYGDTYFDLAWDRGHLKLERTGPVAYYYDGPYPPPERVDEASLRHELPVPPRVDSTLAISQAFVSAVANKNETLLRNTFASSLNSLAAVLAANVSDQLGGARVDLEEFAHGERYAQFRARPGE